MRLIFHGTVLVLAILLIAGCGQKSADLQESAAAPDTVLFENGMKYFEKGQFIKARLAFQTLINTYPDSEHTPVAYLTIADTFYDEGGTENLLQAEAQYKDFIIFYPTHEMADDAQLKIAAINVKLMKPHDRDPTYARKAENELERFIKNYPDSDYQPTAQELLREVKETLARGIHGVADFYFKRESFSASESRYKEILKDYPNFSRMDETLYRLAEGMLDAARTDEASVYYAQIVEGYPFSDYFEEAREKLVLLEKPVPEVNENLAAQNAANRRDESFSIMDPLKSVLDAFTGREDPYELAKRRAEERKNRENPPTDESASGSNNPGS